jgi:hypothetical protein
LSVLLQASLKSSTETGSSGGADHLRWLLTNKAKAVAPICAAFRQVWSTPPAAETWAPIRIRLELRVGSDAGSTSSCLGFLAARRAATGLGGGDAGVDTGGGPAIGGGDSEEDGERLRLTDMANARRATGESRRYVLGKLILVVAVSRAVMAVDSEGGPSSMGWYDVVGSRALKGSHGPRRPSPLPARPTRPSARFGQPHLASTSRSTSLRLMASHVHIQSATSGSSSVSVLYPVSTEAGWQRAYRGIALSSASLGELPPLPDPSADRELSKRPLYPGLAASGVGSVLGLKHNTAIGPYAASTAFNTALGATAWFGAASRAG